ncbi:phosphorylase [Granulicella arctica]|uniref:Adenosylhomocysteine nucleosidase n=1 Tax=Granulicella arctica TaxID=940613 RepID=A0A7Y9PIJ2_9BACT|nr:phosphorylase [Granulicella arctica]NYF80400.1 adenosylhomocysteine nucleosidase [Granulicella arctica]
MNGTIAIIAALPGELKPLVSPPRGERWQRLKAGKGTVLWERRHARGRWIAGCSGMGGSRAVIALREMERYAKFDAICSIGWAGALDPTISAASVWHVARVIDTQTGERFSTAEANGHTDTWPVLATTDRVADATEKARLAASYGARLVDMESATLARIAQGRGIPFYCLKAVSDDADAKLPDLNPFIMTNGQMRLMPFLAHVAMRPNSWRGLVKLGKYSAMSARHLAEAIRIWLDSNTLEPVTHEERD